MKEQNPLDMNIWKCECGNIQYAEYPPDECSKCWDINSFLQITGEELEDQEQDILEDIRNMEEQG